MGLVLFLYTGKFSGDEMSIMVWLVLEVIDWPLFPYFYHKDILSSPISNTWEGIALQAALIGGLQWLMIGAGGSWIISIFKNADDTKPDTSEE
jgi:hypothetical protein